MISKLQITFIGMAVLVGCDRQVADRGETSVKNLASGKDTEVTFENSTLTINGHELRFPCRIADLSLALGPPDRTTRLIFTISTWDEFGVIAYEGTVGAPISSIWFFLEKSDLKFSPKGVYNGVFSYGGKKLDNRSTQNDLIQAGLPQDDTIPFSYSVEDGDFTIIANCEDRLTSFSIGR